MSNKKNPLIISIILLTALLCFTNSSMAADPAELEALRESFTTAKQSVRSENQRKDVIYDYIEQLTDLATDLRIYKHDIAAANAVRKEIRKARKELDADPADQVAAPKPVIAKPAPAPKPEPKPVVAKPAPEPAPKPVITKSAPKPEPKPVIAKPVTKPEPKPVASKPVSKRSISKSLPKAIIAMPLPKPAIPVPAPIAVVAKPKAKPIAKKKSPAKAVATKPAPKPAAAKPAPKPVVAAPVAKPETKKEHTPQTHVNSTQGLAGIDGANKNNIYTFNLEGIGSSTTLAFWATGRNSTDTYGKIWLITPDDRRIFIRIWKSSYFEYPSTEIATYYKLKPITEDLTKKVKVPGTYKVEFEWTEGAEPLIIYRVEITS